MPKIAYTSFNFRSASVRIIEQANAIIAEYDEQGFDLTLRQLYYQFVSRDIIPNSDKEYDKLGSIINDARLAGLIDWNAIVDRTRPRRGNTHWESPADIIKACANQFRINTRSDQPKYIEVWIEKDALVGVLERICTELDVPYFSCRGYVSQSSMWGAAQRFIRNEQDNAQEGVLIHLGDHDPSGVDMSRDIQERLDTFGAHVSVQRIALTMDQVNQYEPPPNPAKLTDSRCSGYIEKYGRESWELDALEPSVITSLIKQAVARHTNNSLLRPLQNEQKEAREKLALLSQKWSEISEEL